LDETNCTSILNEILKILDVTIKEIEIKITESIAENYESIEQKSNEEVLSQ